jgi:hypothetical protein
MASLLSIAAARDVRQRCPPDGIPHALDFLAQQPIMEQAVSRRRHSEKDRLTGVG